MPTVLPRQETVVPPHVLDDLDRARLLAHTTDRDALRAELDRGPVTFYVGFDPTAPSLHMGNLVQLLTAKRLQQAGPSPVDPGGRRHRAHRRPQGNR
jgi:hypothetical protein